MNDRFKFRYWHTKENKYIYTHCDCLAIKNTILYSLIGKPNKNGWFETDIEKAYNNFELVPEQCTGIKDKNGNLIYEGDIVKDLGEIEPVCNLPLVVKWSDRLCGFIFEHEKIGMRTISGTIDSAESHNYEIIGNIHEQKEQQ